MSKPFDPNKPVQTREGGTARIVDTNLKGPNGNILAIITRTGLPDKSEQHRAYYSDGSYSPSREPNPVDLVNLLHKQIVTVYVSLFGDGTYSVTRFPDSAGENPGVYGAFLIAQKTFNLEITEGDQLDLVNVPVKISRWHNVYHDGSTLSFKSRKDADDSHAFDAHRSAPHLRVACVELIVTEGEGL